MLKERICPVRWNIYHVGGTSAESCGLLALAASHGTPTYVGRPVPVTQPRK
jgi:hypothetical protein